MGALEQKRNEESSRKRRGASARDRNADSPPREEAPLGDGTAFGPLNANAVGVCRLLYGQTDPCPASQRRTNPSDIAGQVLRGAKCLQIAVKKHSAGIVYIARCAKFEVEPLHSVDLPFAGPVTRTVYGYVQPECT